MPIKELQEPVWDKQNGETPNQYCYFQEFLKYPTNNLKDFHKYLCENYQDLSKYTAKPPKYNTIKGWSSDNKWTERKTSKRIAEKQDILNTLHELDKADKIEEFILKKSIKQKLLNRIEREAETERLSQIKHGIDAYTNLNDDNRVDKEEPTSYTRTEGTLEVEADTTINNPGLDKIAEAFTNGRRKYKDESIS